MIKYIRHFGVKANCCLHDNFNDQTYFTGGNGVIYNNVFADNGNADDGGEALNVKSGCKLDVAYNLIYNACTNAFKLSNAGIETGLAPTQIHVYNNTVVDCGWRRSKNKKGGCIWLEKGIYPLLQNNLVYDCRYGMKQPKKDGADIEHSVLTLNYFFASTSTGVEQMPAESSGVIYLAVNPSSSTAGALSRPVKPIDGTQWYNSAIGFSVIGVSKDKLCVYALDKDVKILHTLTKTHVRK